MAAMGIPVVLVANGAPASVGRLGTPITIVGGEGIAVVQDDADVPVYLSSGFNAGTGKTQVNEGHLTGVSLPAGTAVTSDGATTILSKADNTGLLAMVTVNVDENDEFENVALPANAAILTDGQSSIDINQYDSDGDFAANVAVSNNNLTVTLANATTRILVNAQGAPVHNSAASKTVGGTVDIDQGVFNGVNLPATAALVENAEALTVPVTGTYVSTATVTVANGVITAIALS